MLLAAFFSWWYSEGWKQVAASLSRRLQAVNAAFSVKQLAQTLFAPWRRIISYPGGSPGDRLRAWADNIFSRTVGFVVRIFVIGLALLVMVLTILFTALEWLAWPLLPLAVPACLIIGVVW